MEEKRLCVLDESKICDNCGECDRCDLDPNKICDNCCRCIAMEDEGNELRSRIIDANYVYGGGNTVAAKRHSRRVGEMASDPAPEKKAYKPKPAENYVTADEPTELTPELVEYWERILQEYGEAPADDGFGEIEVNTRIPVQGKRRTPNGRKKY